MASIKTVTGATGSRTRVRWRHDGVEQFVTWRTHEDGVKFRAFVEAFGNQISKEEALDRFLGPESPSTETAAKAGHTLDTWFERWAELKGDIQIDTLETYRAQYAARISNAVVDGRRLGSFQLGEITTEAVAEWIKVAPSIGEQIGSVTVRRYFAVLHQVLESALFHREIAYNPAHGAKLPKADGSSAERREQTFLDHPEVSLLTREIDEGLPRDAVLMAVGTGARFGELTAFQVRDVITRPLIEVDSEGEFIELGSVPVALKVRRAWKWSRRRGWYTGPPKSKRSKRDISLSRKTAIVVARRMVGRSSTDLLLSWDGRTRLDNKDITNDHLIPAIERSCLTKDPRWHDLRHTHASWLIADKAPLPAIQRRLGHESIATTVDTYGHLMPDLDGEILTRLDDRLP